MKTKAELLEEYADNCGKVELLTKKIEDVNARCAEIDDRLDKAESINDESSVEFLSAMYNALTEFRIELELEKNKLEKEMLEFELAAMRAE